MQREAIKTTRAGASNCSTAGAMMRAILSFITVDFVGQCNLHEAIARGFYAMGMQRRDVFSALIFAPKLLGEIASP
jgi:hypothetical protein